MVQSPSWAANWFAASQEIPRISRNPKVHYRTHKRPSPVSNLGQPNPVHIPTSHLLEIHHNIIHPSTPRSPQWSLSFRFPHQGPIHPPLLTHKQKHIGDKINWGITTSVCTFGLLSITDGMLLAGTTLQEYIMNLYEWNLPHIRKPWSHTDEVLLNLNVIVVSGSIVY